MMGSNWLLSYEIFSDDTLLSIAVFIGLRCKVVWKENLPNIFRGEMYVCKVAWDYKLVKKG